MFEPHVVVRDINPTMDRVAFRARIISLLRVPTLGNPHSPYNMHMLLLDPFGEEIQASVYGPSVPFFHVICMKDMCTILPPFKLLKLMENLDLRIIGPFDCVLLGNYVHDFRVGIASSVNGQNVVLLKLVKGQVCRGRVVCSTVFFLYLPMLLAGVVRSPPIVTYFGSRGSIENQLMGDFPPVTLAVLKSINKAGFYKVSCTVIGIANTKPWFRIPLVCYDATATVTLLLLDRAARVLLKRSCSDFFPLSSEHADVLVEVSDLFPESKDLQLFVTRVGQGIINLKSNKPKANPVTPALNKFVPPFPNMENVHGNDTPVQGTEAKDDDNANIYVGKGKSAFHPYHPNLKRRQLKKNLINEYDAIFPGESSTTTNFYQPNMSATTEDLSNSYATSTIPLSK
ncbi:hypothetical protein RIF29_09027 [Crotalaria pallida]|uniref:Uncharacterized protein n=1 Tax=Crotalaria pallida TaxID=3830 RepID=A0AAN9FXP7_CROPI